MCPDVISSPSISIQEHTLEAVDKFTCLRSTITSNLSPDVELNINIGKAATTMTCLAKRVWDNAMLTINTKIRVCQAYALSTLLYGSEAWTLYSCQQCRRNAFHLRCLCNLLGITWQDHFTSIDLLEKQG